MLYLIDMFYETLHFSLVFIPNSVLIPRDQVIYISSVPYDDIVLHERATGVGIDDKDDDDDDNDDVDDDDDDDYNDDNDDYNYRPC